MNKGMLAGVLALVSGLVATGVMAVEMPEPTYTGKFSACTKDGKAMEADIDIRGKATTDAGVRPTVQKFWDKFVSSHTAAQLESRDVDMFVFNNAAKEAVSALKLTPMYVRDMDAILNVSGISVRNDTLTGGSCTSKVLRP